MTDTPIPTGEVRFFSGSFNPKLAASIASKLGVPLDDTEVKRFSNDNLYIQLGASKSGPEGAPTMSKNQP